MRKSDFKVGLFVLFGMVAVALVIFFIGDARRAFDRTKDYHVIFDDVAGLKPGAPINMGGVLIGHVTKVDYSKDPSDPRIHVTIDVIADAVPRLKTDSVATIGNKGFLGDKMLVITKGVNGAQVVPGSTIPSEEPKDFVEALSHIGGEAESTMTDVKKVAKELSNEQLHTDMRAAVKKLDHLLGQVTEGDGYAHRLLTDPEESARISHTIDNLDRAANELAGSLREARQVAERVRTGPGFLHDAVYGDLANKPIAQIGNAAEEIGSTLHEIRTGDGFAHDVLFGGKGVAGDAMSNLSTVTANLRDIVRGIKQGKGTLGALLVDPSVYEDVKRILGNVERNAVLRSIVRYSIKQNEKNPPKPIDVGTQP